MGIPMEWRIRYEYERKVRMSLLRFTNSIFSSVARIVRIHWTNDDFSVNISLIKFFKHSCNLHEKSARNILTIRAKFIRKFSKISQHLFEISLKFSNKPRGKIRCRTSRPFLLDIVLRGSDSTVWINVIRKWSKGKVNGKIFLTTVLLMIS